MKFVHAADIHLDSPLRGLGRVADAPLEEIRAASRLAFRNLIDLCIAEAASFLILAGDVFDGDWPDMKTGLYFRNEVARLGAAGIPVCMIKGNHDAESQIAPHIPYPDNLFVFGADAPETFVFDGGPVPIALHGQSYAQRDEQRNLAQGYPPAYSAHFNIGVLHTSLAGHPHHATYASCSLDDLKNKGYAYWALGHIHQFEVVAEPDPYVVFPGNLQGRHVLETGPKGCVVVDVEDGAVRNLSRRALDVVRWAQVAVPAMDHGDLASLAAAAGRASAAPLQEAAARPLMLRLRVTGETHLHAALRLERETFIDALMGHLQDLGGGQIWLEGVQDETCPLSRESDDAELEIDPALFAILARIADDPVERDRLLADVVAAFQDRLPAPVQDAAAFNALHQEEAAARLMSSVEALVSAVLAPLDSAGD